MEITSNKTDVIATKLEASTADNLDVLERAKAYITDKTTSVLVLVLNEKGLHEDGRDKMEVFISSGMRGKDIPSIKYSLDLYLKERAADSLLKMFIGSGEA